MTDASQKDARILIVDDDPLIRRLLMLQLSGAGYRCSDASSSLDARLTLADERFSLVLCDLNMPGESGLELIGDLAALDPDMAAIVVSGISDAEAADAATKLGAYGYIVKPWGQPQLLMNISNALRRRELEIENRAHGERLEALVRERTLELEQVAEELRSSREETIRRLSRAGEYRDEATGEHVQRVGRVAYRIAQELGFPFERCELIRIASPLHDIGKVAIPDAILRKPGPLDVQERAIIQRHTEIGHEIMSGSHSPPLELAADIALTHHERFDGRGYPRGLSRDQIPIEGMVAAISDVFDAITHDRVYRPALPLHEALDIIRAGRGAQFSPAVVDAFVQSLTDIQSITSTSSRKH